MNEPITPPPADGGVEAQVRELHRRAGEMAESDVFGEAGALLDELLRVDDAALATAKPEVCQLLLDISRVLAPCKDAHQLQQVSYKGIQALQVNPAARDADLVIPFYNLMVLSRSAGNTEGAAQAADSIVALADQITGPLPPGALQVFDTLGAMTLDWGQADVAAVLYRQLYRHHAGDEQSSVHLHMKWAIRYAGALLGSRQAGAAETVYSDALRSLDEPSDDHSPWTLSILSGLGSVYLHQDRLEAAGTVLERARALAEGPEFRETELAGVVCHNLASLILRQGAAERLDEAEALTRRALEIVASGEDPTGADEAGELAQLARIAVGKGDPEQAERRYARCLEVLESAPQPNRRLVVDFLGEAAHFDLNRQKTNRAVTRFERALEHTRRLASPADADLALAHSNLAIARFEDGDLARASEGFRTALRHRHAARSGSRPVHPDQQKRPPGW